MEQVENKTAQPSVPFLPTLVPGRLNVGQIGQAVKDAGKAAEITVLHKLTHMRSKGAEEVTAKKDDGDVRIDVDNRYTTSMVS